MLDLHFHPEHWGIRPVLFYLGAMEVPSYSFFVLLGLIGGTVFYIRESKKDGAYNERAFLVLIAALVFGTLGAKLPILLANYKLFLAGDFDLNTLLSGRTIVGGLIGGTLGVMLTKKICKVKVRMGNQIAPAAALGMSIGRIGCLLRGCCYGIPTGTRWGIDFGDGILRHPTQIYEAVFDLALFILLLGMKKRVHEPGKLFTIFLNVYFLFRFLIEFIRVNETGWLGLTWFQVIILTALIWVNRSSIKDHGIKFIGRKTDKRMPAGKEDGVYERPE